MVLLRAAAPLGTLLSLAPVSRIERLSLCAFSETIPPTGGPIIRGDESIMSAKAHGTTAMPVQQKLRWGVSRELAESICCYNREGAERSCYFTECKDFTNRMQWKRGEENEPEPIVFYDSVSGKPLFVAPVERTMDAFLGESLRHGWPSFRQAEVVWCACSSHSRYLKHLPGLHGHACRVLLTCRENVRVIDSFEVVSVDGTHLGHQLPDSSGPRFCINLCCVAGRAYVRSKPFWPLLRQC